MAYKWINELGSKLDMAEDEMSGVNLCPRLCTLAATCFSTYDVCLEHVPWILTNDDDIAIAVHCPVIVHDNTPSVLEDDDSRYLIRILNRHRPLLHFLESFFRIDVKSNPSGFDRGLASLWLVSAGRSPRVGMFFLALTHGGIPLENCHKRSPNIQRTQASWEA